MHNILFLIDANGLLFKFFYAIKSQDGASKGFMQYIQYLIKNYSPKYMGIVFDISKSIRRTSISSEYKKNRTKIDPEIINQQNKIIEMCKSIGIQVITEYGYEADDIIASYTEFYKKMCLITIVSSDKDLMCLLDKDIKILDHNKNRYLCDSDIKKKFGTTNPKAIPIIQSIAGDASDNIKGAKGIGIVNAAKICMSYDSCPSLDEIYSSIREKFHNERIIKLLYEYKDEVYKSYALVLQDNNIEIKYRLDQLVLTGYSLTNI